MFPRQSLFQWRQPCQFGASSAGSESSREMRLQEICIFCFSGAAKLSGFNKAQEPVLVTLMPPGETFGISALLPAAGPSISVRRVYGLCTGQNRCPTVCSGITLGVSLLDFRTVMGIIRQPANGFADALLNDAAPPCSGSVIDCFCGTEFQVRDSAMSREPFSAIPLTHQDLADLVGATRQIITSAPQAVWSGTAPSYASAAASFWCRRSDVRCGGSIDPPEEAFMPRAVLGRSREEGK